MRALIAFSGGVDSAFSTRLMMDFGYSCVALRMKLFDKDEAESLAAEHLARSMGIEYHELDLRCEFRSKVIDYFINSYENALTPNPCVECNKFFKFGVLDKIRREYNCELLVTGHYARVERENGEYVLRKALCEKKDQSYVLYNLNQELLSHVYFPLGELAGGKDEVRALAKSYGITNFNKPDSEDICFVPHGDYKSVIRDYTGRKYPPGDFVDKYGKKIGTHKGLINYTLGQRRGLGIAAATPLYVLNIDKNNNRVILGDEKDLYHRSIIVKSVNFISGNVPDPAAKLLVKARYRHKGGPARLLAIGNGDYKITFDEAERALTPGQSAVFYDGDKVLGGGVIAEVLD